VSPIFSAKIGKNHEQIYGKISTIIMEHNEQIDTKISPLNWQKVTNIDKKWAKIGENWKITRIFTIPKKIGKRCPQ